MNTSKTRCLFQLKKVLADDNRTSDNSYKKTNKTNCNHLNLHVYLRYTSRDSCLCSYPLNYLGLLKMLTWPLRSFFLQALINKMLITLAKTVTVFELPILLQNQALKSKQLCRILEPEMLTWSQE